MKKNKLYDLIKLKGEFASSMNKIEYSLNYVLNRLFNREHNNIFLLILSDFTLEKKIQLFEKVTKHQDYKIFFHTLEHRYGLNTNTKIVWNEFFIKLREFQYIRNKLVHSNIGWKLAEFTEEEKSLYGQYAEIFKNTISSTREVEIFSLLGEPMYKFNKNDKKEWYTIDDLTAILDDGHNLYISLNLLGHSLNHFDPKNFESQNKSILNKSKATK